MIQRDSVSQRFESREEGISYTEFSYMLLQAYDFLELHRRHGCRLQIGRVRSVGQHRVGRRPGAAARGQDRLRPDHAAADRRDGEEIRQEREGGRLPGPEADVAVRVLSVLAQHRRRQRRTVPALADGAAARGDRGVRGGAGRRAPRRSGRWPRTSPAACTATRELARVLRATEALFGGGDLRGLGGDLLRRGAGGGAVDHRAARSVRRARARWSSTCWPRSAPARRSRTRAASSARAASRSTASPLGTGSADVAA